MAKELAKRIDSVDWSKSDSDSDTANLLENLSEKVGLARSNVIHLYSGPQASEALYTLLSAIDFQIDTIVGIDQVRRSLGVSSNFKKSIKRHSLRLEDAIAEIDHIDKKIILINSAYDAAEKLPLTMEELEDAIKEIEKHKISAAKFDVICEQSAKTISERIEELKRIKDEANATLEKVSDTYRAVTSQGLASAFQKKSDDLKKSVDKWLWILIAALIVTVLLAYCRIPKVLDSLAGIPSVSVLIVRFVLGVSVIAPPIWLAWVATKQIGQRFRLAEDYAYKAALSAAYEGYKSEAARLDPSLEEKLFSTAINRLDEIPLRFVEKHVHGSPINELFSMSKYKPSKSKESSVSAPKEIGEKDVRNSDDVEEE